ncbi:MAG: Nif3-like dinuclear metal center hexameric protein [Prevotellaceae bacterium]|jgi:dinuclear metal center YbgI/SA1388 family protein|nr:Nif3-like dinuclear metal center hexameric protein [Prevotellaceae bacterium]
MTKIKEICRLIEQFAPPLLQESYDNSGLLVGSPDADASGALLCVDVTESVVNEAISHGINLIVAHHPFIFGGIKKLTGADVTQRIAIQAISNKINIFAAHTNIDCAAGGVSVKMAQKLDLQNVKPLAPREKSLLKLAVSVPKNYAEKVRTALFDAGAGKIGNYDLCSYNSEGYGTFRAGKNTNAFVGKIGELHNESETRIEVVLPFYLKCEIESALLAAHPYEEPSYDFYLLENQWNTTGFGAIGDLRYPMETAFFLEKMKKTFDVPTFRYTDICNKMTIKRVAMCGGAGSFLIKNAKAADADIFITGDIKYHDFFLADNQLIIADIGHYESEQFVKEIFYEIISENFANFAVRISEVKTNPVNYYF